MDESRAEVGTRKRPLQVSHLERAVIGLHLRARGFELRLANACECGAALWIVSQFLPLRAPGIYRRLKLRAGLFRHLRRHAIFISRNKGVAFRNANLSSSRGSRSCCRRSR